MRQWNRMAQIDCMHISICLEWNVQVYMLIIIIIEFTSMSQHSCEKMNSNRFLVEKKLKTGNDSVINHHDSMLAMELYPISMKFGVK